MSDQKIFISYRRVDSSGFAGRLFDRLSARFGDENIFMDVEDLDPGVDFFEKLGEAVAACDVLIAVIGRGWLDVKDSEGHRRLDSPEDFVRIEIAAALDRDVRVIPVLVQDAKMPGSRDLPTALQPLTRLNALEIRHERFNADVDRLTRAIERYFEEDAERRERETAEKAREQNERERQAREFAQQEAQIAAYLKEAQTAIEREDWQTAQTNFRSILKLRPDHIEAQDGLQTSSRNLELGQLYGHAILQQDEGHIEDTLRTLNRIQSKDADYRDVPAMILAIEKQLAVQARQTHPGWRQRLLERMSTLPRGLWYLGGGVALILMLVLAIWGGSTLLGSLNGTETPLPVATTPVALVPTGTKTPTTAVPTGTSTPTRTATKTSRPATATFTLLPSETHTTSPVDSTITPNPTPVGLPILISDDYGVSMALVPAGPFQVGSQAGDDKEKPVHTITLDDFYIDQYEVTNARYAECVDAGVCNPPASNSSDSRNNYFKKSEYAEYPVIHVSWGDAQNYCQWRDARLPTEAEWEKAARGGLESVLYPWGNEPPVCEIGAANGAKFDDGAACNDTDTEKVGSYSANGYDLYDMAGNVWEWTLSVYQDYPYDPEDGRENLESSDTRVLRGGSWDVSPNFLRVTYRGNNYPNASSTYYGFRCARSP
ncbi:SUMF1/EgtB/PvdO family nonheme iron enzyme [Chloroflexota bacterium]